jgi:predicted glutamine amidotransferase
MLAYSGTINDAYGTLREFRRLAEEGKAPAGESLGHRDGWGIICYDKGMPKELGRRTGNATLDEFYVDASKEAARLRPRILLAHLRKASRGMEISLENTQPLQRGSWSFAHNGTIWSPRFRRGGGQSDSVIFLEKLLENIQTRSDSDRMDQRILKEVKQLRKIIVDNPDSNGRTYTSITFILSDGNSLWVLRDYNDDRDEDYYTMHYLHSADFTLFCQQKIIPGNWKSIENRRMAVVDRENELEIVQCL